MNGVRNAEITIAELHCFVQRLLGRCTMTGKCEQRSEGTERIMSLHLNKDCGNGQNKCQAMGLEGSLCVQIQ